MDETTYIKIACPSCTDHVEFPVEMRGQIISCPHCSLSMALEVPGSQPEKPPSANLYQRLRALNRLDSKPMTTDQPGYLIQNVESRP
jgi:hypothetical protein